MSGNDRTYRHEIHRIGPDGTPAEEARQQIDTGRMDYFYDLRGTDNWETAERWLVDQSEAGEWEPGRYRITVTRHAQGITSPVCTVERLLPLCSAYSDLPYKPDRKGGPPARAYVHHLVEVYVGTTLELVAEHLDVFDRHYKAIISTRELTDLTGHELPADRPRPLSPYARYHHPDDVPESLK